MTSSGTIFVIHRCHPLLSPNVLKLRKKLFTFASTYLRVATDFRRNRKSRYSLNFHNFLDANNFIDLVWSKRFDIFQSEMWYAYAPTFKIYKQMILRGFDDWDFDCNFICHNLVPYPGSEDSWIPPIKIEKNKKRVINPDTGASYAKDLDIPNIYVNPNWLCLSVNFVIITIILLVNVQNPSRPVLIVLALVVPTRLTELRTKHALFTYIKGRSARSWVILLSISKKLIYTLIIMDICRRTKRQRLSSSQIW